MSITDIKKEEYRELLDKESSVIIKYGAPWCTYCRRLDPAFKKVAKEYDGKIFFGEINIDEAQEIAEENKIEVVPTLVLYKDGKRADAVVAPGSKADIEKFIKENLDK